MYFSLIKVIVLILRQGSASCKYLEGPERGIAFPLPFPLRFCIMGKKRQKRRLKLLLVIAASILLLVPALAALLIFVRSPLLIVTDNEFIALYGSRRTMLKGLETSIRLMRRVKPVPIADGSGPDVIAFAVDAAAREPFGVIFPYRYDEGARLYAAQAPNIPVAVQTGTAEIRNPAEGIFYIRTDRLADCYRAGLCAAGFVQRNSGGVLFFEGNSVISGERAAFIQGLRQGGYENTPVFLNSAIEFDLGNSFSCVVIAGAARIFLDKNPDIPMIVFSWLDPARTSQAVKIIFDDSPWALALPLAEALSMNMPPEVLPSETTAFKARIGDEELWQVIQKIITNKERYE
jgi:hypothetical protein